MRRWGRDVNECESAEWLVVRGARDSHRPCIYIQRWFNRLIGHAVREGDSLCIPLAGRNKLSVHLVEFIAVESRVRCSGCASCRPECGAEGRGRRESSGGVSGGGGLEAV